MNFIYKKSHLTEFDHDLLGTWAYTSHDLMFKADVETSTLAESSENFSGSGGWSVLEYRGIRSSVYFISVLAFL